MGYPSRYPAKCNPCRPAFSHRQAMIQQAPYLARMLGWAALPVEDYAVSSALRSVMFLDEPNASMMSFSFVRAHKNLVPRKGLEPLTPRSVAWCSDSIELTGYVICYRIVPRRRRSLRSTSRGLLGTPAATTDFPSSCAH